MFKEVKEKCFGEFVGEDCFLLEWLKKCYDGLMGVINCMFKFIKWDKDEFSF